MTVLDTHRISSRIVAEKLPVRMGWSRPLASSWRVVVDGVNVGEGFPTLTDAIAHAWRSYPTQSAAR